MLHDAVIVTLFIVLPQPKYMKLHHLKETKGKLWKQFMIGLHGSDLWPDMQHQTTNGSKPCSISIRSSNVADPHPRIRGCGSARLDDRIEPNIWEYNTCIVHQILFKKGGTWYIKRSHQEKQKANPANCISWWNKSRPCLKQMCVLFLSPNKAHAAWCSFVTLFVTLPHPKKKESPRPKKNKRYFALLIVMQHFYRKWNTLVVMQLLKIKAFT